MTGYLTQRGCEDDGRYRLVIPNREIQNIVTDHILVKFQGEVKKDGQMADAFCHALMEGKANEVETLFTAYMEKTNQRKFLPWYSSWNFEFQDWLGGGFKSRVRNWT